jgi:urease accessory protein
MKKPIHSAHHPRSYVTSVFTLVAGLFLSGTALAHSGYDHVHGVLAGISHPIGGLDHLLAMLGVGIWAAQMGGKSRYLMPLSFVGVMLLGAALGMSGFSLPYIEEGILASVMVVGLLLSLALTMPVMLSAGLVGFFAVFHGFAHGAEMPITSGAFAYMSGFALSTAALHLAGVFGAQAIKEQIRESATRITGLILMLAGTYLALA